LALSAEYTDSTATTMPITGNVSTSNLVRIVRGLTGSTGPGVRANPPRRPEAAPSPIAAQRTPDSPTTRQPGRS
jgi:hypothetical protein